MAEAAAQAETLVETDEAQYKQTRKFNTAELIAYAAKRAGKGAISVTMDARKYKRGNQKIELDEYVKFRLYDENAHSAEERGEFISWLLHARIIREVNDERWFAITEDKWISAKMLEADGIAMPKVVGMIDTSARAYHGGAGIDGPEKLRSLIGGGLKTPLFGKANRGLGSVGVFTITQADQEQVSLRDLGTMDYEAFFRDVIGENAYILQEVVQNHADIRAHTDTLATIRMVNMIDGDGVYVPAAVLKLPSSRNMADNFWREGNMLCNLDPETGEILTLVSADGPGLVHHEAHPESGAELIGTRLPHWEALREVNERVAKLHSPLRYQSTDMAITEDGPVVIEVNAGSSFTLPQYASGKGLMTPKVRALFRSYGSEIVWA